MLFEPCGDLRRDYSAYCETLRLTEREDVYSAVHTSAELEQARADQLNRARTSGEVHSVTGTAGRDGHGDLVSASISHTIGPFGQVGASGAHPAAKATARPAAAAAAATAASAPQATETPEENPGPHLISRPNLFFLRLRHPSFCVNQRDMTPLCRAIPHCPALVSIELVGCGLSVESYLLLVEAAFRSRRIVSIAVDFNHLTAPGFLADPTVVMEPSSRHASITANENASDGHGEEGENEDSTPPPSASATPRDSSASGRQTAKRVSTSLRKKRSTKVSAAAAAAEAAAEAAASVLANSADEPGAVYLKPTEFCGLHTLRSPLEDQIQEEHEKKGKVDPKKLSLLQQQNDTMNALNVAHRIKLPRSWEGILFTGVRHLSLRGNGITDDVVEKMILVLTQHPYSQLISLNLWGNAITDRGATALAQWLHHKDRRLRVLDLGRNSIGDTGLLELANVFRMRELASMEEVAAYRQQVLSRPGATAQERAAANQPMPTAYPSYQELFNGWFLQAYPTVAEEVVAAVAVHGAPSTASGGTKGGKESGATSPATATSASGKRGAQGAASKGKAAKAAADVLPTLARPTTPFDRHCVRVVTGADVVIRVPGNTVLEVLNVCENAHVTVLGAREAVRRLHLHEPATEEEFIALTGGSFFGAFASASGDHLASLSPAALAAASVAGISTPADHLTRLISLDEGSTDVLDPELVLARPIPHTSEHGDSTTGHVPHQRASRGNVSAGSASTSTQRRRSSAKASTSPQRRQSSVPTNSGRKDKDRRQSSSSRASLTNARRGSGSSTSVSAASSSPSRLAGTAALTPSVPVVTTPELHCADVRLRSFGLFTHRYNVGQTAPAAASPAVAGRRSDTAAATQYGNPEHVIFADSVATTVAHTPPSSTSHGEVTKTLSGSHEAEWQCFARLQDSMNEALNAWCAAGATSSAVSTAHASGATVIGEDDGKGRRHGSTLGGSVRPGSREKKTGAAS